MFTTEHKGARAVEGFKNGNAIRRGCCRDDRKATKQNSKQCQCQSAMRRETGKAVLVATT
jgi:hypothetical protein